MLTNSRQHAEQLIILKIESTYNNLIFIYFSEMVVILFKTEYVRKATKSWPFCDYLTILQHDLFKPSSDISWPSQWLTQTIGS